MEKENKLRNPAVILPLSSRFAKEYYRYLCELRKTHTIDEIQESKELTIMQRAFWTALIIEIGKLFDTYSGNKEVISLKKLPSFENCPWKKKIDIVHGEAIIQKIIKTRNTFTAHFGKINKGIVGVTEICNSNLGKFLEDLDQPLSEFNQWLKNKNLEQTTNKKECPKCHGENIIKLATFGSDKGDGSYTFEPEEFFYRCADCEEHFSIKVNY